MSSSDDASVCSSLRTEELQVLRSIYPDYIVGGTGEDVLHLEIPVELGFAHQVHIGFDQVSESSVRLTHLPPLLLDISFSPDYPLSKPPTIVSIRATHSWLPQVSELAQKLRDMWSHGEGVLFNWVELIHSGDFLHDLGHLDTSAVIQISSSSPDILTPLLLIHDSLSESASFSLKSYSCSVCLTSLKGSHCLLLSCSHVFCRSCLQDYWGFCISEGDVGRVGCPHLDCVKQGREADEREVRKIVSDEELKRWKWLRGKRAVEKDPTIIHCPIPSCQAPVERNVDESQQSGWDRLRTCQSCGFVFCSFCKHSWHGPLSACQTSATLAVVLEYLGLPEDSSERLVLERKYGKGVVLKLVRQYLEEESNKKWIEESAVACPGCKVNIEKSAGCNHMSCVKCRQHFCYRCGVRLSPENPYAHFSTPGSQCFNKLFDFQSVDNEWQPIEGFNVL